MNGDDDDDDDDDDDRELKQLRRRLLQKRPTRKVNSRCLKLHRAHSISIRQLLANFSKVEFKRAIVKFRK